MTRRDDLEREARRARQARAAQRAERARRSPVRPAPAGSKPRLATAFARLRPTIVGR
jgi:hypothetical protein